MSLMSKSQEVQDSRDQHAQLSKLLDRFETNEHVSLSSEMAHELMDSFFELMVQNIKAEWQLLKEDSASLDQFHLHHEHATALLTECKR